MHTKDDFRTTCLRIGCNDPGIVVAWSGYTAEELQLMCESLSENKVVHTFYVRLSAAIIQQNGMRALAQLLKRNVTLKKIDVNFFKEKYVEDKEGLEFNHMQLEDNDALAVGNALKVNNSIQSLKLTGYPISDVVINHICDGLQLNCTITELWCTISSKGMLAVSDMLQKNTSIKRLGISGEIRKEAKETFARTIMEYNFTLEDITVLPFEESLLILLNAIARLNTNGCRRKLMSKTNELPAGLWADVFAFAGAMSYDLLFYFVKSKPELFKLDTLGKKRKRI